MDTIQELGRFPAATHRNASGDTSIELGTDAFDTETMTGDFDTSRSRAETLAERADTDPGAVDVEALVACLATEDEHVRHHAARAFTALIEARPESANRAAEHLADRLLSEDEEVRNGAAMTVAQLADRHPDELLETVPALIDIVEREFDYARNSALLALATVGETHPDALEPALPTIRTYVRGQYGIPTRERATRVLAAGAVVSPDAVEGLADELLGFVREYDGGADPAEGEAPGIHTDHEMQTTNAELKRSFRRHALQAVSTAADHQPSIAASLVDELAAFADDDDPVVRAAALASLVPVAESSPDDVSNHLSAILTVIDDRWPPGSAEAGEGMREDGTATTTELAPLDGADAEAFWAAASVLVAVATVEVDRVSATLQPAIETIEARLSGQDPRVRTAAANLLSIVAEHDPSAVSTAVPALIELLDDQEFVRASAAIALGYVGNTAAVDALQECASRDPSEDVRATAVEAIELADQR